MKPLTEDENSIVIIALTEFKGNLIKEIHQDCKCADCDDKRDLLKETRQLVAKLCFRNLAILPKEVPNGS